MKRLEYVDVAKAIGIYLVVLGHLKQTEWDIVPGGVSLTQWVYAFHMPFFFIIAGFVSRQRLIRTRSEFLEWIVKMFQRYFIPYLMMMMICNGIGYDKLHDYLVPRQSGLVKYNYTLASWWLPCFIVVHSIVQFYDNIVLMTKSKSTICNLIAAFILFVGIYCQEVFGFKNIPYYANVAFVGAGLFLLGRVLRQFFNEYACTFAPPQRTKVIVACMLAIVIACSHFNTTVYMVIGQYGNPVMFLLSGIAGSIFLIFLGRSINGKLIQYIGQNTIVILMYHGLAIEFVNHLLTPCIMYYVSNEWLFICRIMIALICVLLMVPIIYLINRFIPELAGRESKAK